jgi:regulatory protein
MLYFEVINLRITSLTKQKKNKDRYNIYVDDEFLFSANFEDLIKLSLKEDKELNEVELQNIIDACEGSKAYDYALFILSIRDYTSSEMERKLRNMGFSNYTINKVLDKLKAYGIIDDSKYIKKYVSDGQKIKKYGIKKIMYNLANKGIEKSSLESIEMDNEFEFNNAFSLAQKKLKIIGNSDKQREKIYRYLISKGYEYEIAKKVIDKIFRDNGSDIV